MRLGGSMFEAEVAEGAALEPCSAVAYALVEDAIAAARGPVAIPGGLSAREREVAVLVAQGFSNRAIAQALVTTERTAEGHVERSRGKLGFQSRAQVAAWAVRHDLLAA